MTEGVRKQNADIANVTLILYNSSIYKNKVHSKHCIASIVRSILQRNKSYNEGKNIQYEKYLEKHHERELNILKGKHVDPSIFINIGPSMW